MTLALNVADPLIAGYWGNSTRCFSAQARIRLMPQRVSSPTGVVAVEIPAPDVLAAQHRERARIHSEKALRWGGRPAKAA
ncbi:hypothetical protein [Actinacidiphila bryophytorum]